VISFIDSEEVSRFALDNGITLVDGDELQARWVANQIVLTKAVAETGATKIITFHSRVNYAKRFSGNESDGICSFLKDFKVNHVNGQQKTSDRKEFLMQFRNAAKGLITNARCLTEVTRPIFCTSASERVISQPGAVKLVLRQGYRPPAPGAYNRVPSAASPCCIPSSIPGSQFEPPSVSRKSLHSGTHPATLGMDFGFFAGLGHRLPARYLHFDLP